jgi:catechol 2,3-dioxygenase-like lactoylglutathione lyase family enzyme
MTAVRFEGDRVALAFGAQKINLHEAGREFEPRAGMPAPGSADLCFIVEQPLEAVARALDDAGLEVILGPVPRTGASGPITSLYLRDPDGNLVELARYDDDAGDAAAKEKGRAR